jgi:hypothetical protein
MPTRSNVADAPAPPTARRWRGPLSISRLMAVLIAALCCGTPVLAGPSVAELLAVCERASAAGNTGVDAAICEWYAVPCDCKSARADAEAERWCLPANESVDSALPRVMGVLRLVPYLAVVAEQVVPGILSRLYPCERQR